MSDPELDLGDHGAEGQGVGQTDLPGPDPGTDLPGALDEEEEGGAGEVVGGDEDGDLDLGGGGGEGQEEVLEVEGGFEVGLDEGHLELGEEGFVLEAVLFEGF